jgi:TolB-like protein/tetratricopeptide (TPR) repeat protein
MDTAYERAKQALADRYDLEGEIGSGGMAVVYRATDLKHDRSVAIKILRPDIASSVGPERFLREIEIASRLQHPNLVALFDSGQADDLLYYVMPYVEGESLRARLDREKQLPVDEAEKIVDDIAEGLEYAHQQGVVHRDIKPENILLTQGGAVLADFGIAQAVQQAGGEKLTKSGVAVGTPVYMAPEQAGGIGAVDFRADQYALACVLYEMLVGEPPFTGPTPQVILARHATDPVPSIRSARSTVPEGMEQAVLRALAKTPADRFPSATGFVEALGQEAVTTGRGRLVPWIAVAAVAGAVLWATLPSEAPDVAPELDPRVVLIVPFENLTGDPEHQTLGLEVWQLLNLELNQLDELEAVSLDASRAVDSSTTPVEVATAVGAGTIVQGSYTQSGDQLRFTVELRDATEGTSMRSPDPVQGPLAERDTLLMELRNRTIAALWLGLGLEPELLGAAAPQELGAIRAWSRVNQLAWDLRMEAAERELREAIDRYPDWTPLKLRFLAFADQPSAARDSMIASIQMEEMRSERDRAVLRLHRMPLDGLVGLYDAARDVEDLTPGDSGPLAYALQLNRPNEAIERANRTIGGAFIPALIKIIAWHRLGRHGHAIGEARQEQGRLGDGPIFPFFVALEAAEFAALNQIDSVRAIVALIEGSISAMGHLPCVYSVVGRELIAHDLTDEGMEYHRAAVDWYESQTDENSFWCELSSTRTGEHARALYEAGYHERAAVMFRRTLAESDSVAESRTPFNTPMPEYLSHLYLARIAAQAGDTTGARMALTELPERYGATERFWDFYQGLGAVATLIGEFEVAKSHLRRATSRSRHAGRHVWSLHHEVHIDADFDALRAAEPEWYQQFMAPRG